MSDASTVPLIFPPCVTAARLLPESSISSAAEYIPASSSNWSWCVPGLSMPEMRCDGFEAKARATSSSPHRCSFSSTTGYGLTAG